MEPPPIAMRGSRLLAAALLAAWPAASAPAPEETAKATPAATPRADRPPIYDPEVDGDLAIRHYLNVGASSNRRVIVFFGTDDCAACRVVNEAAYEEAFHRELFKQFVPAFVDVTPGTRNAALPQRWGIDPTAPLPGVVILDSTGNVTEVLKKGELAAVAKKGKEAVQLWILQRFYRSKPQ